MFTLESKDLITREFDEILDLFIERGYRACSNKAADLTRFSWQLELKEELFINQIIGSISARLHSTVGHYNPPEDFKNKCLTQITKSMKTLISIYKSNSKNEICDTLKELEYLTTYFELTTQQKYTNTYSEGIVKINNMQYIINEKNKLESSKEFNLNPYARSAKTNSGILTYDLTKS